MPPRATMPPRRWIASISAEYTNTSNSGNGFGISGTASERSLNDSDSRTGR